MNSNTYIQYLTKGGQIKTIEVEKETVSENYKYTVQGIQEEFFLLNLFDNNKKVVGITFDNIQNLQMLAFLNSDFQTIEVIPEMFFINAFETVILSIQIPTVPNSNIEFPATQNVFVENFPAFPDVQRIELADPEKILKVSSFPFYDPYYYPIKLNLGNKKIEGIHLRRDSDQFFGCFIDTLNDGLRSYAPDHFIAPNMGYNIYETVFQGFTICIIPASSQDPVSLDYIVTDLWNIDFLLDTEYNIFDIQPKQGQNDVDYYNIGYWGCKSGIHKWNIERASDMGNFDVYVAYKIPVGQNMSTMINLLYWG